MKQQVAKEHYTFQKYGYLSRWASYYYQLDSVLNLYPRSILDIGVGDHVFEHYIEENTDITYTSLDIAEDLRPDIVADITKGIDTKSDSFDVVCAFEVLEHIPFQDFERVLEELKRVARTHVVISLPHFGPPIQFLLKLPFLPTIRFACKLLYPKEHIFNGEHYWEIGKKGYTPKKIRNILQKHFSIEKEFVPFENQYHHFYVLRKES